MRCRSNFPDRFGNGTELSGKASPGESCRHIVGNLIHPVIYVRGGPVD